MFISIIFHIADPLVYHADGPITIYSNIFRNKGIKIA
jgi:hypothetical protein